LIYNIIWKKLTKKYKIISIKENNANESRHSCTCVFKYNICQSSIINSSIIRLSPLQYISNIGDKLIYCNKIGEYNHWIIRLLFKINYQLLHLAGYSNKNSSHSNCTKCSITMIRYNAIITMSWERVKIISLARNFLLYSWHGNRHPFFWIQMRRELC